MGLTRFERGALALIVLGVAVRCLAFLHPLVTWDPAWYMTMARTLLLEGEFTIPWTPEPDYTQHYPPAFPAYIAAFNAVLGFRVWVAQLASLVAALFLLAATFYCTRDLYGRSRAFGVTAIVATFPFLIYNDARVQTETIVVAFYALTIWGILKSLDKPKYIVVAGVFAALGYLTKSSMGPFFVLAGLGGLAWRFYYVRWRVFTDRYYLLAAALFAATVFMWAGRNVLRHGWPNWETQPYASRVIREMFASGDWPMVLLASLLWSFCIVGVFAFPFLGEVRESFRRIREERTSALWLAIVTPVLVAVFFVAGFAHDGGTLKGGTAFRYVVAPLVPVLWLGMRVLDLDQAERPPPTAGEGRVKARFRTALVGVGILALTLALDPTEVRLTGGRILALYALLTLGLGILAASWFLEWKPVERRTREGGVEWRAVASPADAGVVARGGAYALLAFVIATFVWVGSVAYTIPAVAGSLLQRPGERVLAVATLLLASSFAGVTLDLRIEETALDLAEVRPGGGTVGVIGRGEFHYYPFLPDGFRMVPPEADPDLLIVADASTDPTQAPANYTLERVYEPHVILSPGTWLRVRIDRAMGALDIGSAQGPTALYVRTG